MSPLRWNEGGLLTGASPTLAAVVGPLSVVGFPVTWKGRPSEGGFPASSARAGVFLAEGFGMCPEAWTRARGSLPRVRGALPAVTFLVEEEGRPPRETLPAPITPAALPCVANSLMEEEGRGPSEGFSAKATFVRFLSGVGALVKFESAASAEGFPTVVTFGRLPPRTRVAGFLSG